MADYARLDFKVLYGKVSDYSDQLLDRYVSKAFTTPVKRLHTEVLATTSGLTVELGNFSTILAMVLRNLDTTNFVDAKFRYEKASKTFGANKLGFTATAPCTITDDDSTFVSTLKFKKGDYAVVSSATEAANSGTFLVQAVAAGTLTLEETAALTLDADDAGTPTIKTVCENELRLTATDGWLAALNVRPDNDLVLTADTASCYCEVIIFGT